MELSDLPVWVLSTDPSSFASDMTILDNMIHYRLFIPKSFFLILFIAFTVFLIHQSTLQADFMKYFTLGLLVIPIGFMIALLWILGHDYQCAVDYEKEGETPVYTLSEGKFGAQTGIANSVPGDATPRPACAGAPFGPFADVQGPNKCSPV